MCRLAFSYVVVMQEKASDNSTVIKVVLVAAAIAVLYWTVLAKLGIDWWTDENYSHGLFVPLVVGWMVWSERAAISANLSRPATIIGLLGMVFAILMLTAGSLAAELFTQRISLVVIIAAVIVYFGGLRVIKPLVAPFLILLLAIPIPQILFNQIAFPLQLLASRLAVWGIRLFDVPTLRKGNVIEILPQGATQSILLEVVEACSGIRSLMTLVTLALVLGFLTKSNTEKARASLASMELGDLIRTLILMMAAVPIAVITNGVRVAATGIGTYYYGRQAVQGAVHDASGWLVYVGALILLLALNYLLTKFIGKGGKIK